MTSRGRRRCLAWAVTGGLAGLAATAARAAPEAAGPPGFHALPLTTGARSPGFALTDLDGRRRTESSFPGQVAVLFFGFLSCPAVCPTTLAELSAAREAMGRDAGRVRLLFATLDPQRDTAAAMRSWLQAFAADAVGLRDTADAIERTTRALRLDWNRVPGRTPASYTIDHGVQSYVFDPSGRLRLLLRPGPTPREIAADWRRLLAGA